MNLQSAARRNVAAPVHGIRISRPEKVMWPASGKLKPVTKQDLAEYYLAASDRIMPHIEGRPVSVVRAPDGIEGQHFFQRHLHKGMAHVRSIKVEGENEPYLCIDGIDGLVELAQAAVLEIHPWGARKSDPETPERIIFDLDPAPDVDYERVIAGAKEIRRRLESCGLQPFVKTTGGKGLHVVVAVKGTARNPIDWADVKEFARDVCMGMAADSPDRYIATMSKAARTGKVFLDYLRNDKTSTAVAPWSPRARPGAPIAVPLEWSAVRKGLNPKAFNIWSSPGLLRKPDAWKGLAASAGLLHAARKRLASL